MTRTDRPPLRLLELVAAGVLLAVVAALGWMIVVAYLPATMRLPSLEMEIVIILVLLSAALLLVSLIALLHTRG
jgi:hypothetical protein